MQYHLDGFRAGDPRVEPAAPAPRDPSRVDVAIIGCGPAGLTLAAQLAKIGGLHVRIFERKNGPLEVGQADGIACRSLEMFEAFGFAPKVLQESYWVNETSFWRPGPEGLIRADRIQDVEDDLSHQPHVILNQARVHDFYLKVMRQSASRLEPEYSHALTRLVRGDDPTHPVQLSFDAHGGPVEVRAKYVVGCDGARSAVRGAMGYALKGEAARQLWGVMDVLAVTDFPDIRLKAAVQSEDQGSILIIPREGGYMARLYIELDELHGDERASDRDVSPQMLEAKAQAILAPYSFEVREVAWWSAYEIGQRVCDRFDDGAEDPRIFIAGDACHTHSPKAGQGMNVSMADAFNLSWKLAAVLKGRSPTALLQTYSAERQAKAQELIDFDRDMARLFSEKPKTPEEAAQFQRYFQQHGRYTAGVETTYAASPIVGAGAHQDLANGLLVGKRFHSGPVVRLADARPMQLSETLLADGRWRVIACAGADLTAFANDCAAIAALIAGYTPQGADPDEVIELLGIYPTPHRETRLEDVPPSLLPRKGALGLIDYEKVFTVDARGPDVYDMRGIDRRSGALVLVRPDQFVAEVLPLDEVASLAAFFAGVLEEGEARLPGCDAPQL